MRRRIACIFLPDVRVAIVRAKERAIPSGVAGGLDGLVASALAIVVARRAARPAAVKSERDVLGNTRIDVVSAEARALGVRPGQNVAAAKAKAAGLRVRVLAEEEVQTELARVAEAALSFGPSAGFDAAQDVVWVDVSGCQHLRGGERELALQLGSLVAGGGHACRIAIADGPRVAAAAARFSRAGRFPVLVPEGKGGAAMRGLPIAALGLDDETNAWLRDLGLRTCGDVQRLPRRSIGTRLGARALDVMQLLDGDDRAPLVAWRPPEVPEERISLDWGLTSVDALVFVLKSLCDRLASRIERRAMAASRLELVLLLDRALCGGGEGKLCEEGGGAVTCLHVVLPTPMTLAGDFLAVLRARLESYTLAAPVLAVTLRAPELTRNVPRPLDMLAPEPKAQRALPRLVAELGAELGAERVGTLALVDTWLPAERTRMVPFGVAKASPRGHSLVTAALEPTRLVEPERVARGRLAHAQLLARVEAPWWEREEGRGQGGRSGGGGRGGDGGSRAPIDLVSAWVGTRREGALAWVELEGDDALLRGWLD